PELPVSMRADEKRLRQVLLNLLGNAVKFTEKGQITFTVTVSSQRTAEDIQPPPSGEPQSFGCAQDRSAMCHLQFSIKDTGVGIAPEHIERIFQPFEQAGASQQRAAGTGLGLAISQQLVELMGGHIQVCSDVGQGSTFWFEAALPIVESGTEA